MCVVLHPYVCVVFCKKAARVQHDSPFSFAMWLHLSHESTRTRPRPLQVRIVRIFNTYGPRMALDDGRVVSNFVSQALTEQPITVYGDGSQTRSFQ